MPKVYRFSQLQAFLRCPRYYQYNWVEGFERTFDGTPKPVGSALHGGVEALCEFKAHPQAVKIAHNIYWEELNVPYQTMSPKDKEQVDKGWLQVLEMLKGYRIPEFEETIATEQQITIDMGHDRQLQGTVDRIFKVNGLTWILDTKTTGYDIAKVLKIHRLRKQFPGYVLLAQSQGHDVAGVYVDLVYKPRVYFKVKSGVPTGEVTVQKALYHREPLAVGAQEIEDFKGWFHHIASLIEMNENPSDYWQDASIICPDQELQTAHAYPMNTDSCLAFNRVCPFFEACRNPKRGIQMLESNDQFKRREDGAQGASGTNTAS